MFKNNKGDAAQANVTEVNNLSNDIFDINLSVVIFETNMVGSNMKEWWVDTGATRHVCAYKKMFSTYNPIGPGEQIYMGNFATATIAGKEKFILKITSTKKLTLNDVIQVPDIRENLVSGSILSKKGFKLVFESDKLVLTKERIYVGKGYLNEGLIKMNVMTIVPNYNNNKKKNASFAYLLECTMFNMVDLDI